MIAVNVSTHTDSPAGDLTFLFCGWINRGITSTNRLEKAFFVTAFHSVLVNNVWISLIAFYLLSYEGGGGFSVC